MSNATPMFTYRWGDTDQVFHYEFPHGRKSATEISRGDTLGDSTVIHTNTTYEFGHDGCNYYRVGEEHVIVLQDGRIFTMFSSDRFDVPDTEWVCTHGRLQKEK